MTGMPEPNLVERALLALPEHAPESRFATLLLWLVAGITAVLLLWAALAEVAEVVRAPGRVVPASRLQVVSNLEGGVVRAILVRAGDRVAAGQPLVRLDPTASGAELARGEVSADALAARAARLQAAARGGDPVFGAELLRRAPSLVANEQALHLAQRSAQASEEAIADARVAQAERGAAQALAELGARSEALAQAEREAAIIGPLVAKGVEAEINLLRADSQVRQARSARDAAALGARRAQSARAEALSARAGVARRFRANAAAELAATRAEEGVTGSLRPALEDRVARTEVRSPVAGTVNRVLVNTVGGTVRPGEPVAEVVPQGDRLVVDALVRPADIGFVRVGQSARVKLSAYDFSIFGSIKGRVERVSPDATVDERTGEASFVIRVALEALALEAPGGGRLPVGTGMTADVEVEGQSRSVLAYLLTPVTRLRDTAFRER